MVERDTRTAFRTAIEGPQPLRGCFVKLAGLEPIDCAAAAGADFCVIDLEHAPLDERTAFDQVAYARALGLPCLVRLAAVDAGAITRWLDAGATGIQVSDVGSPDDAAALVRAGRYPPRGERGVSPSQRDGGYGALNVEELVAGAAGEPVLVAQIERELDAEALGEIAGSGVDGLFVGPVDLAVRLGGGAGAADRVRETLDAVAQAALRAGAFFGHHVLQGGERHPSARYVTVASDTNVLRAGLRAALGHR
jgi:4-hydroxy-2-oxoheptanedioate aldolase